MWIFGLIGVAVLLTLVVLLSRDLRESALGKTVAALSMSLFVASGLYGILPFRRGIRAPASIATAAAFYLVLFPRVANLLGFAPPPLDGYVTYTQESTGVPGVEVRVPNAGISSITDAQGEFTLKNVPRETASLRFRLGRLDTVVAVIKAGERRYAVVPRERTLRSANVEIPATEWRRIRRPCTDNSAPESSLFLLEKTIRLSSPESGPTSSTAGPVLSVQLTATGVGTLGISESSGGTPGRELQPSPGPGTTVWRFDPEAGEVRVRLLACINGAEASPPQAVHWTETIVRS